MTEIKGDKRFNRTHRRRNGIYYTSSQNIGKLLIPLLENVTKENAARCTFFDPACGSGNFLVETKKYLEEKGIATEERQYAGIEIEPAAVEEAKRRLPGARIVRGNALTMDWGDLVTPSKDLFIFGNPPFAGDYNKSKEQQKELENVFAPYPAGKLDYCAAWYYKAAKFLNDSGGRFAFVSTNSITQGAQVRDLFKPIFDLGWKISFAWPSVLWDNDASVYVVIIGFTQKEGDTPRIFDLIEDEEFDWKNGIGFEAKEVENISPYNLEALPTVFINPKKPLSKLPEACFGSQHIDGNGLILSTPEEKAEADKDPVAAKYVRKYMEADELINNKPKWCLWLVDSTPEERRKSKFLKQRIESVRIFRSSSRRASTKNAASRAWEFASIHQPDCNYLAIPRHFSKNREYFTVGYESPDVIASDALFTVEDPDGFAFSVIESSMFMAWQGLAGGRIGEGYRFSNTLVWNTFPLPSLTEEQKDLIIEGGRKVLEARADYPSSSLADLYDPDNMPPDLKKAHEALDKAVDAIFSDKPLRSEEERQKALLEAYEEMTGEKERE